MPTGGVSTEEGNLRGWFDAVVTCVGMGSQLIANQILSKDDYEKLSDDLSRVISTVKLIKQQKSL